MIVSIIGSFKRFSEYFSEDINLKPKLIKRKNGFYPDHRHRG